PRRAAEVRGVSATGETPAEPGETTPGAEGDNSRLVAGPERSAGSRTWRGWSFWTIGCHRGICSPARGGHGSPGRALVLAAVVTPGGPRVHAALTDAPGPQLTAAPAARHSPCLGVIP